ncbi:MAG: AAA family ATPase, partial [Nitrolancea sp.]
MAETARQPYLFVSYASADRERVWPVVDALRAAGVATWLDEQGIAGGENYAVEIGSAVKGAALLLLMASPASLSSRNVRQEIALAWRYERPFVPLRLDPVGIPDELAYWLEAAQWVDVLNKPASEWLPQVLAALAAHGISPAAPSVSATVTLAGRERELGLLHSQLAAARAGRGGLVLIGGEAGVGKSSLAETTLRQAAEQGCAVLEGHCFDLADTPPYGPFIDLFARYVPDAGDPLPPPAFAARGMVGAVPTQIALFVQVRDFLTALSARRPLVALLDDLHWADPASFDLLRYLARGIESLAALLLVTYRSDELTRRHPLYAFLPQLSREAIATRLDLGVLDEAAVRALVSIRYGLPEGDSARLAAYVQSRAEGNALFTGEVLRSLEEANALVPDADGWRLGTLTATAVPPLLRQVIDGRLDHLGEDARILLAVAAVLGQEIPLELWAKVGEVSEDALSEVLEWA